MHPPLLPNPLRAFEVLEPLAAGGMGQVLRGRHRRSGQAVAVKLLLGRAVATPAALEGFAREARAAARLDHPHITRLIDYGLTEDAQPVLIMELASGGDLSRWVQSPPPWATLRDAIGQLLDALAHAHARGLVHRDLKPGNVLLRGRRDRLRGVALTDLGLAISAQDRAEGVLASAGTPRYMAPEQAQGELHAIGPWTDLYGLGALVWTIAQGSPPPREDEERLALAWHPPRLAAPPGLGRWLCGLLAPSPWRRPRHAAAAAAGLGALEGGVGRSWGGVARRVAQGAPSAVSTQSASSVDETWIGGAPAAGGSSVDETWIGGAPAAGGSSVDETWIGGAPAAGGSSVDETWIGAAPVSEGSSAELTWTGAAPASEGSSAELTWTGAAPASGGSSAELTWTGAEAPLPPQPPPALPTAAAQAADVVPLPESWRPARRPPPPLALLDAGLGLHSLREPELVGRDAERDALWAALRRVEERRAPEAVVILGGVGVGRSRLVTWLAQRAQELAGVAVAAARIGPGRPFVVEELVAGLRAAEGLLPEAPPPAGLDADERGVRALRRLRELAGERALVITLDDVAWSGDALRLAERALTTAGLGPTLLVLSAQQDALASRPAEAAAVERLSARALSVTLGNLPPGQRGALVSGILRLTPELRTLVAERSAGNPLFATLLVGDWVKRDALAVGEGGFCLKAGVSPGLHADLAALQESQVAALQASLSEDDWRAVGVASALGVEVDTEEWRGATAEAGLSPSPGLESALVEAQILRPLPTGQGWVFTTGLLRESLLAAVGATPALQLACARALGADLRRADRIAQHRLAGGDAQGAFVLALAAARQDAASSRIGALGARLRLIEGCLARGAQPTLAERAALLTARGVFVRFGEGRAEAGMALFEEATPLAEAAQDHALQAELLRRRGGVRFTLGHADGETLLGESLALAEAHGLIDHQIEALRDLSTLVRHRGAKADAEQIIRRAIALAEAHDRPEQLPRARVALGMILMDTGRAAEARTILEGCLKDYADGSSRLHRATFHNSLAAAMHELGEYEGAQEHYWRAYTLFDEVGSELSALPRYNVADIYVKEGRFEEARALMDEAVAVLKERPSALMSAYVLSMLMFLDAKQDRLELFTPHLQALGEALEATGLADRVIRIKLGEAQRLLQARPEGADPATLARIDGLVTLQETRLKG
jgi:tetratricopeptide (TPR) repeat protein